MITWWNNTILIDTVFAIRTVSFIVTTPNNTFSRSAYVARSTIFISSTYLWHADFVPTLIFKCAVIVVFTRLVTFAIDAITFFATLNYTITWSSWISNISIGYSPQQSLFISVKLCQIEKYINQTNDYLVEWHNSHQYSFCHPGSFLYLYYTQQYIF